MSERRKITRREFSMCQRWQRLAPLLQPVVAPLHRLLKKSRKSKPRRLPRPLPLLAQSTRRPRTGCTGGRGYLAAGRRATAA